MSRKRQNLLRWSWLLLLAALVGTLILVQPEPEQPIFSAEKTARIMADLFLAQAASNGFVGYSKDSLTHIYYAQIFEIHGVSESEYEKNLRILAQDEQRIERVVKAAVKLVDPEADLEEKAEPSE